MTPGERWLATLWPLVRARLPAPPARVVDIGCGPFGGFVPFLRSSGYEAVGVDPKAPETAQYHRIEFEHLEPPQRFDAAIASTSLHHVTDPAEVIDRLTSTLTDGGALIVVEWDWDKFDEATAQWCFERLGQDDEANWLQRRRNEWAASGREWQPYLREWATRDGLHRGETLLRLLSERFERRLLAHGPYFFPDLANTTAADEQAAIDAGEIQATRIDWVGTLR
jgi:SAM-dependent methyltransferase